MYQSPFFFLHVGLLKKGLPAKSFRNVLRTLSVFTVTEELDFMLY